MLTEYAKKVKLFIETHRDDISVSLIVLLTGLGGFGLGRLSTLIPEKTALTITESANTAAPFAQIATQTNPPTKTTVPRDNTIIGSRTGSTYHYAWCPGALKIKAENKIIFTSKEDAKKQGYTPANNCPGL